MMKTEGDITCPHCGTEQAENPYNIVSCDGDHAVIDCDVCEKSFHVTKEVVYREYYITSKT